MGQHKKSKSWSALISLPTMLTPSSASGTQHTCQPLNPTDGTIEMKKSSSHQHHQHQAEPNEQDKRPDDNDDPSAPTPSIPSFYLFSSEALADESAPEDSIIPYMEPATLAMDQATLIAGVLESLVRVVDDIPTGEEEEEDNEKSRWSDEDGWATLPLPPPSFNDDPPDSPFTIIGLGSFKVALWPALLTEISHDQDLSLVVLVAPTYPDHTIIDTMYRMKQSLNRRFTSVVDTTNIAQLVGRHLSPLIKNGFSIECSL